MNMLAHIYLSGEDEQLTIGNFIADFVKGNKKNDYPDGIRKGIELHRAIDFFTDHHPLTALSRKRLYERHHKYSGVLVDIFYDHFLASDFSHYSEIPLAEFAEDFYKMIFRSYDILPEKVQGFLPFMIERNWLNGYSTTEGITKTLTDLGKRVAFQNKMNEAGQDLFRDYEQLRKEFTLFFPQLITFTRTEIEK